MGRKDGEIEREGIKGTCSCTCDDLVLLPCQEGKGGEGKTVVVSISPQARASIAAKFGLSANEVNFYC